MKQAIRGEALRATELGKRRNTVIVDDIEELKCPQRLQALASIGLMDSPREPIYDRLTKLACTSLHCPVSLLTFVSADEQFFKSYHGLTGDLALKRGSSITDSFCRHVVERGSRVIISDAQMNLLTKRTVTAWSQPFRSYAGFPIISVDKFVLGAFCVIDRVPRFWSKQELARLKAISLIANQHVNFAEVKTFIGNPDSAVPSENVVIEP